LLASNRYTLEYIASLRALYAHSKQKKSKVDFLLKAKGSQCPGGRLNCQTHACTARA
jgi:hypothetical protein